MGGLAFALSTGLTGASVNVWMLLGALVLGNPATGAFVSLAQATLMDRAPARRERNMAWWTLAGSLGYVAGPLLLAAAVWIGIGWRGAALVLAVATIPLVAAVRRAPAGPRLRNGNLLRGLGGALAALRRRDVLRWLLVLEATDLLLDVLHGFLALYFVDVVGYRPVDAAFAVAVWTGASFAGDALLVPLLRYVPGRVYLRMSGLAALVVYPAFLVVPGAAKLVLLAALGVLNSGWYAIPKAGLYGALPGRSGTAVAVGGLAGIAGAGVPIVLGIVAGTIGLGATMWILLAAPVALVVLVRRQ